ncbi:hypothetical protein HZH68_008900 [Vespula germanica]|uniref:Uncharacterized protein n=1 Tax=Vespula germanica TaxID=30212 RepID=A0A834K033_VESGE|nr:hypothetical protein HZH68_008900 [Vespula germanica]
METFTESNGECPPVSSRFPKYPAFPGAFRRVMPSSGWISSGFYLLVDTVVLRLLALTSNDEATLRSNLENVPRAAGSSTEIIRPRRGQSDILVSKSTLRS